MTDDKTTDLASKRVDALALVFGDRFASTYLNPVAYIDDAVLASPPVISFYRRQFGYVSKVMTYEYQYRSWNGYDQTLLDRYSEIINKKLGSIGQLLDNNCSRLQKLLDQNSVPVQTTLYSHPMVATVPIICGPARAYFGLLEKLDTLHKLAGTANLFGVITSTQRAQAEVLCKKAVRAFEALLRNEVNNIYREASRLLKAQRDRGTNDAVRSAQVEEHKQDIGKIDGVMASDADSDSALNLGGADPSTMIDEAVAATNAATKAGSRKAKAEPTPVVSAA
jgi:hypothetical protein